MAGTTAGGAKTRETNIRKYGEDYYRNIGSMGGKARFPGKGFGTDNRNFLEKLLGKPTRAQLAGRKGGSMSKRTKTIKESN